LKKQEIKTGKVVHERIWFDGKTYKKDKNVPATEVEYFKQKEILKKIQTNYLNKNI